jgi:hypothetical protein
LSPNTVGIVMTSCFELDKASDALDNEEDGVSSDFLKGKQNSIFLSIYISFIEELCV